MVPLPTGQINDANLSFLRPGLDSCSLGARDPCVMCVPVRVRVVVCLAKKQTKKLPQITDIRRCCMHVVICSATSLSSAGRIGVHIIRAHERLDDATSSAHENKLKYMVENRSLRDSLRR